MTENKKPWEILGISRATYFRWKKERTHESLMPEFKNWVMGGVGEKPKSHNYFNTTVSQLNIYFELYPLVSVASIRHYLSDGSFHQRRDRHAALSMFCRFMVFKGLMSGDELENVKKYYPKKSPYYRPKQRILTTEQVSRLASLDDVCLFLSETGLRISEYCQLKEHDLNYSHDPTKAIVTVRCGKGGKGRVVPFSKRAQEARLTFDWTRHTLHKYLKAIARFSGIDFTAHSFRHYRITQWANDARIPVETGMLWAGHESYEVYRNYIHLTNEEAMKAAYY